MTEFNPLRAAIEKKQMLGEISKLIISRLRDAERCATEAEAEMNALMKLSAFVDEMTLNAIQLVEKIRAQTESPGDVKDMR